MEKMMIDPELKYCPDCKDEYRSDFSTCAACNKELISGADLLAADVDKKPKNQSSLEITGDDTLVVLQKGSMLDMKNMKRNLAGASVPAILTKDDNKGCCGVEMYLHIRMQDKDRAIAVLNSEFEKTTELHQYDLSTADAVFDQGANMTICPACGYEFMPTSSACPDCGLQFS
jgi:hypothetical protein